MTDRIAPVLTLIAALALLPAGGSAETYRWIDEQGNVTYSNRPPQPREVLPTPETRPAPETKPAPELKAPDAKAPEPKTPETKTPQAKTPDAKTPEARAPEPP